MSCRDVSVYNLSRIDQPFQFCWIKVSVYALDSLSSTTNFIPRILQFSREQEAREQEIGFLNDHLEDFPLIRNLSMELHINPEKHLFMKSLLFCN